MWGGRGYSTSINIPPAPSSSLWHYGQERTGWGVGPGRLSGAESPMAGDKPRWVAPGGRSQLEEGHCRGPSDAVSMLPHGQALHVPVVREMLLLCPARRSHSEGSDKSCRKPASPHISQTDLAIEALSHLHSHSWGTLLGTGVGGGKASMGIYGVPQPKCMCLQERRRLFGAQMRMGGQPETHRSLNNHECEAASEFGEGAWG